MTFLGCSIIVWHYTVGTRIKMPAKYSFRLCRALEILEDFFIVNFLRTIFVMILFIIGHLIVPFTGVFVVPVAY
jgi:hypothetical protein